MNHDQIMTTQITLEKDLETEYVCINCIYFTKNEESSFCSFFDAFLSEETLCIPCDFKENILKE